MMATVQVDPGICGFNSIVHAVQKGSKNVSIAIESDCEQVILFAGQLELLSLREVCYHPFNMSLVYDIAGRCNLHPGCPIPCAVIKAAEVAFGIALKKDVTLVFNENQKSL